MTIDLTPIVQALVSLLAVWITAKIIPWLQAKTTAQQQQTGTILIRMLVYAAEQIYGSKAGAEKMAYVQRQLTEHGYVLDVSMIEAAVREMNLWSELSGGNNISVESAPPDEYAG